MKPIRLAESGSPDTSSHSELNEQPIETVGLTQGTLATSTLHKPRQGRVQVASGKKELRAKLQKADNESTALQVDPGGPASLRTTDYL